MYTHKRPRAGSASRSHKKVPCAPKRFDSRFSYNQNEETFSRSSLRYLSKASLPIAVN